MQSDPFGLFPDEQQAPVSAQAPSVPVKSLVIGVLVIAALWCLGQKYFGDGDSPFPFPSPDPSPPTSFEPGTLIFIHERSPQAIEHDLLLRQMPVFCETHKVSNGFRAFDDDSTVDPVPAVISWAGTKGVQPPLIVLTDASTDMPQRAMSWELTTSPETLAEFIK